MRDEGGEREVRERETKRPQSQPVLKVWMDGHGRRPGTYFQYVLAIQPAF